MKIRSMHLAAVAFALLISADAVFAQTVTLRYRWTKGEELGYRFTQQTQTSMSGAQGLPGLGAMSMDQKVTQTVRLVVDDVAADGSVTLREIVESVRIERNMPALPGLPLGNAVFDSANGDVPTAPDQIALAGMIGKPIKVVMSPNGAVQKMEGATQIFDDLTKSLSLNTPGAADGLNALRDSFDDQSLGSMQAFAQFPDRALKAGDSWDRQRSMNNPISGKMTTSETFSLQRIDGNIAHIKITSTTKQDGPAAPPPFLPPNMQMQMHIDDTTAEGELLVDVTKGRLQRSGMNTTGNVTMSMSVPGPNGAAANMTMATKTATSTVMELFGQ